MGRAADSAVAEGAAQNPLLEEHLSSEGAWDAAALRVGGNEHKFV